MTFRVEALCIWHPRTTSVSVPLCPRPPHRLILQFVLIRRQRIVLCRCSLGHGVFCVQVVTKADHLAKVVVEGDRPVGTYGIKEGLTMLVLPRWQSLPITAVGGRTQVKGLKKKMVVGYMQLWHMSVTKPVLAMGRKTGGKEKERGWILRKFKMENEMQWLVQGCPRVIRAIWRQGMWPPGAATNAMPSSLTQDRLPESVVSIVRFSGPGRAESGALRSTPTLLLRI